MNQKLIAEKLSRAIKDESGDVGNLSWLRWINRLSQMELGLKSGVSQARISQFERGY